MTEHASHGRFSVEFVVANNRDVVRLGAGRQTAGERKAHGPVRRC